MRMSPTPQQLEYLASLGVSLATPVPKAGGRNPDREAEEPRIGTKHGTLRIRTLLGLVAGACSGVVGLLVGGFFGLITHELTSGVCLAFCAGLGWLMIGFLWSFGWKADSDLGETVEFCDARIGIQIATVLGAIGFGTCFCGMLVAVIIGGQESARAWVKGTLLALWTIGLVPGAIVTVFRLIQAQRR